MAKQLNVNLAFNAETAQAKRAIEDLSNSLRKIQLQPSRMFDDVDLKKASQAAQDLEKHLRAAVNVDTGKLDLNKFSQSLASSKQNLGDLYKDLSRAGADGQAAFLNLAKSINAADSSTLNLGSKLRELTTTLKNTARWEISSKIMHGFESAISSAYNYAQDLNKSLNDIRIVTGQSSEQMAEFADRANKAAKALSTSTTNYTDASLIYYQQGLSDAEVEERTAVTIKMANAAGVSAKTVSDQLTAVWNNFDDGSKSLEYYADVMTALGAATASSTDEISQGLNKFAAVAETVGLSYEYATAALATVTAETRESADVVGTAYKTLFARIQGLQQGDTMEDGTTLNKYSAALAKVGIDIKTVSGDMKDMDTILEEMGAKWGTLAKDQQLALAQTVAGVRQYNQLVALMDNWDVFQTNLDTAYNAEGTLQEQADIYAESWEAASKRVQAAAQGIYQELLNDDFFIGVLNIFEDFLSGINNVIEGVGGLKTILLSVSGILLRQYAKEIPQVLTTFKDNIKVITGEAETSKLKMLRENAELTKSYSSEGFTNENKAELETLKITNQLKLELTENEKLLSQAQIAEYNNEIRNIEARGASIAAMGKEIDAIEKLIESKTENIISSGGSKDTIKALDAEIAKSKEVEKQTLERAEAKDAEAEAMRKWIKETQDAMNALTPGTAEHDKAKSEYEQVINDEEVQSILEEAEALRLAAEEASNYTTALEEVHAKMGKTSTENRQAIREEIKELKNKTKEFAILENANNSIKRQTAIWTKTAKEIQSNAKSMKNTAQQAEYLNAETTRMKDSMKDYGKYLKESGVISDKSFDQLESNIETCGDSLDELLTVFNDWQNDANNFDLYNKSFEELNQQINQVEWNLIKMGVPIENISKLKEQVIEGTLSWEEYNQKLRELEESHLNISKNQMQLSEAFGAIAGTIMEVYGAIEAIKNLGNIWSNEDLTTGEKIFQTMSAMIPVIMTLTQLMGENNVKQLAAAGSALAASLGFTAETASATGATIATKGLTGAIYKLYIALGPVGLVLALIAATMATVALAAWGLSEAISAIKASSLKGQLENANKTAKDLKSALDDAKTAAQELQSAFDSYDSAVEALENCTKGTQEWRDALQAVNNEVLNLLNSYPELASYIQYGKNGEMTISDEGRQMLFDQSNQRINAAQAATSAANANIRELQVKIDTKDLRDSITSATIGLTATDAQSDGGNANDKVVNYLIKNAKQLSGQTKADQITSLEKFFAENGIISDAESWISAIQDLGPEFGKLASAIDANTAATKAENQAIAANTLVNNKDVQNSLHTEDIVSASGAIYDKLYEQKLDELNSKGWKGKSLGNLSNQKTQEVWQEYLTAAGLNAKDNYLVDVKGRKQNRVFVYGEDKKEISLEAMKTIVASANAIAELGGEVKAVTQLFSQLSSSGSDADKALQNLIADKDLSDSTKEEADALLKEIDTLNQDGTVSQEEAQAYVNQKFGEDYDFTSIGFDDAQDFINTLIFGLNGIQDEWKSITDSLVGTVKAAFEESLNQGLFEGFSLQQTQAMADMFNEAFRNAGPEGVKSLQDTLGKMFDAAGDEADELAGALGGVDWQTTNINELCDILEDAGVNTNGFRDELLQLIDVMKSAENLGFDAAAEHYSTINEIAQEFKDGNKIISSEDAATLESLGIDMDSYFNILADGTYKLKGDAEEFYNILREESLSVFKQNIEALRDDKANASNLLQSSSKEKISEQAAYTWDIDEKAYNVDKEQLALQLDFLDAVSDVDTTGYRDILENGRFTLDQLNEIQSQVEANKEKWDTLPDSIELSNEEIEKHSEALAHSAKSLEELNNLYAKGYVLQDDYKSATEDVMKNEFEMEGLDPDIAYEVAEAFQEMANSGDEAYASLKNDAEAVKDATVRYMKLNSAIEDIYDNYKDYTQVLKDVRNANSPANKELVMADENAKKLRSSLADLIGTSEDLIDANFLSAIDPKDFEAAANGSAEAIERIRNQFIDLQAEIYNCENDADAFKQRLAELSDGAYIDLNADPFLNELINAAVQAGATAAEIEALLSGFGIDADVTPFTQELWEATQQAQAAGENIANATSFTTEVEQTDVENPRTVENPHFDEHIDLVPQIGYNTVTMDDGFTSITYPSEYVEAHKSVAVGSTTEEFTDTETVTGQTVSNGAGASGQGGVIVKNAHKATSGSKAPSAANTSRPAVSSGGGGGGGSSSSEKEPSKPNKTAITRQNEIVERFKELNDTLDDLTHAYEKASRAADRLYGTNRLKALKEQNELLKQQQQVLAQKLALNEAYLEQDRKALQQAASAAGLTFSFDSNGNLSNYTSQMQALYNQLAAAENHYNSLATGEEQDSYTETILDPLRDKISELESAMSLYEETKELFEDIELEMEDIQDQIYQNNYDIIMEGLELRIKVNEDDLKLIDYYLSKIEDDFYSMAEAAALIAGPDGTNQLNSYLNNLKEYEAAIEELNSAYVQGEITEAMWNEGIQEVKDSILDNLSSLNDLDKQMKEYYGETLDMAQEELEKFTNELEQQTEILEHYQTMMEILGKQMDYDSMGVILKGQVETIENEMEVAEAAYELYKQQADQKKQLLEDAIARGDTAAAEIYQKEWEAAQEAALDAQDEMLDKTEQWAEAMRAVVENELAGLARSLEEALTGGTSFDYVNTQLERAASLQEEYLTTTNQIYETNKLMRTAQQEIDKSTNLVAKQRLKDFIKETNQLQNKSKLSKYELEIQQAKYNLLLAEIALEDAQNAKTSVRLQRDSEGNFGYVYVADQSQLAKAQQDLEDAQNTLYNIGLDGVNEYTEKYAQTMQEMYDTLTSITEAYYNGEITSQEDYEAQMLAAQQYYYEKLENYQDLYGIALETDTRAIQDSWASGFKSMIYNTNTWKEKVADYTKAATLSLSNWYNKVEEISNKTGLDNIANSVKNVTDKSEELRDKILEDGGVVDALYQELESVSALTRQYAEYRSALQQTIIEYERLITQAIKLTQANREAIATSNAAMEAAKRVQEQNFSNSVLGNTSSSGNSNSTNKDTNTPKNPGTTTTTTETNSTKKYKISYTVDGTTYYLTGIYTTDADAESRARAAIIAKATTLATTTGADNVKTIDYQQKTKLINSASVGKITTWDTDIALLDSGGYTGDWGPQGKLAVLHEKEIVLNKNDTANFLASMEILERILNVIDLQTMNSQLGGLTTPSIGGSFGSSTSLDQNVHIEASFPGVQDRHEIEEAFNTLINKASQYANRK